MENQINNPLLCDPETGICEMPAQPGTKTAGLANTGSKPLKLIYFTDPICSTCWGIEPQLRKLKLTYGHLIEVEYHMGGLLPDWSYNSGGISKPSDVAHHWDEVSAHYQMPIDGDVWLEDPLDSSYPPSIAFKAAQLQDEQKAISMLRIMREMVFLKKMNIARPDIMLQAANQAGLNAARWQADYNGAGQQAFEADLALARGMGVRGFPSIFITDAAGRSELVYGCKPYAAYLHVIQKLAPQATPQTYDRTWQSLFARYKTLTTREFAELSEMPPEKANQTLNSLLKEDHLHVYQSKNGPLWFLP
jgi:predicted DsbA family dithiol-disulfide isomerase